MDEDKHSTLLLKDGRILSYAEYGDPQGLPMIGFHGMPGSRLFMKAFGNTAQAAGVRLIAPERPGYGYSSSDPGGTLLGYTSEIHDMAWRSRRPGSIGLGPPRGLSPSQLHGDLLPG